VATASALACFGRTKGARGRKPRPLDANSISTPPRGYETYVDHGRRPNAVRIHAGLRFGLSAPLKCKRANSQLAKTNMLGRKFSGCVVLIPQFS
jgi:hypothetical protein